MTQPDLPRYDQGRAQARWPQLVLAPDGAPMPPLAPQIDSTLVKAIARAFRWQRMLETGRYVTIKEIAKAEKINPSYISRVLRLTLLAPALVERIVAGRDRHPPSVDGTHAAVLYNLGPIGQIPQPYQRLNWDQHPMCSILASQELACAPFKCRLVPAGTSRVR